MYKKMILALVLGGFVFALEWADSLENAKARAKKENKIVMIMFSTEYCATCEYMKERIYPNPTVDGYLEAYFIPVEVDIDAHPDKYGFKVFGTPTYYFLRPDGAQIGRAFIGGANAEAFVKKLQEYKAQTK